MAIHKMEIIFLRLAIVAVVKFVVRENLMIKKFITSRLEERTTWDGAMLIGIGLIVLIAGPFAKLAAYIAIGYGAWTIYKSE
tara:strand:- start:15 stop:260 length:246 start_codon:yes stop_codon:yes gene_type:complete